MSSANDETVVALYDYASKDPEELSIRKNEQLTLIDAKFTWWKVHNASGKVGLVPSNYLRRDKAKGESFVNRIAHKLPGSKKGKFGTSGGTGVTAGGGAFTGGGGGGGKTVMYPSAATMSAAPNHINEQYVSKFSYEATKDDELSLTKGMRILVLEMEGDGWWYGRDADHPGNPGWFPSNYVTKDTSVAASNAASSNPTSKQQNNGCIMVVRTLYPLNSGVPEELAFEQDELLDIIDQPPDDPEWWLARNTDGTTGLVPKNYIEAVPDAQSVSQPSNDPISPPATSNFQPSFNGTTSTPHVNNDPIQPQSSGGVPKKEWFFGALRRTDAEKLLTERAKNGEFLVRNSETAPGEFSISMKTSGRPRHFKVSVLSDGQYGIGQRIFESLDALLEHYKRSPIYTSQEQGKLYLTNPLPR